MSGVAQSHPAQWQMTVHGSTRTVGSLIGFPSTPTPSPAIPRFRVMLSMQWGPLLPRSLCVDPLSRQITEERTPTPRMGKGPWQAGLAVSLVGSMAKWKQGPFVQD